MARGYNGVHTGKGGQARPFLSTMIRKSKLLHQPEPEKSRHLKLGPVELRAWRPSEHGMAEGVVLYVLKDAKCIT